MKWVFRLCLIILVLKLLESYQDSQQFRQLYRADRAKSVHARRYTLAEIEAMDWSTSS